MMNFEIELAIEILSRTPKILQAWLSDIPETWGYCNEGNETWSAFDVVGHFIHGERTGWSRRAQLILSGDDDVPEFEPFDRFAQFEASKGKTLAELLAIFAELRAKNLEILRGFNLQPADFEREGKHPELGIVNLKQLLATWVVHDLDHLGQIGQVMARQYRDEVGPWGAYLTILEGA
jgi:hypothetical protein